MSAAATLNCGDSLDGTFTTIEQSLQRVVSCSITAPAAGTYYIHTSTGLAFNDDAYEALMTIGIDSTPSSVTSRYVNIYSDLGGSRSGNDKSSAISYKATLTAGTHTFSLLAQRFGSTFLGTVALTDPSISVIWIPAASQLLTCGAADGTSFSTTSTTAQVIRTCSLNVPTAGFVYLSANGSAALNNGQYEAEFRLGIDSTTGSASTERYVNVYRDSGDGTDETVDSSLLVPIAAGNHNFYFLGSRYSGSVGTGTVMVYNTSLSVIFVPNGFADVQVCAQSDASIYSNATLNFTTIRSCNVTVARAASVFVDASASAAMESPYGSADEYEGKFRIGADTASGNANTDRYINVYADADGGTDRVLTDALFTNVSAGPHTFYFVGRRNAGTGTVLLFAPSISVLVLLPDPAPPTPTATNSPTATATSCPIEFQDVPSTNTFYANIRCLACRGILGGYPCGAANEPCGTSGNPYFRYGVQITRGQIAKVVSQSAGFTEAAGTQVYEDVPTNSPFYDYIQRLSNRGYIGGYPCGGSATEPCVAPGNRPYFRPQNNATRGQISKIVATAGQITDPVSGQLYTDVPTTSPFYMWIQQLSARGAMSEYPCGGAGEPCDDQSRPYFRPSANVTRGQAAKIVANTFFPNCQTPARP